MKIVDHLYLAGVRCREDGAVWVPQSGSNKAHWTFGSGDGVIYRQVSVAGKRYKVHRLICEAFHGPCPPDKCQVDHIDRDPSNNRPENLRWATPSENVRNRRVCEEALTKYGVSQADDVNAYQRARYANNPEERERRKARSREYRRAHYAKKKKGHEASR